MAANQGFFTFGECKLIISSGATVSADENQFTFGECLVRHEETAATNTGKILTGKALDSLAFGRILG